MSSWIVACRTLLRRPAFLAASTLTLGLGVAATTTSFSVVDTVLIKPLPFPNADRLVSVMETNPSKTSKLSLIAPGRLEDWNSLASTFDAISGWYSENVTDTSVAEPERLEGRRVAPRYLRVFSTTPTIGRIFTDEEERAGGPRAAVISDSFWKRRYAGSADAIGKRLVLGGVGYTIVGVMPSTFTSAAIDVWLPAQAAPQMLRFREARFMSGIGRMKPGVTIEQARADLARVQQTLGERFPASDRGWSVAVEDWKETHVVGEYRRALWLVFGAVALLLAIAVANIAGLLLVQLHRRGRELAVRQAIGGSRRQIVGAVMMEIALVTALGSAVGAAAAYGLVQLFAKTFATVPRMNELSLDARGLAFALGASAIAAVAFGVWPALQATRGELTTVLAQSTRGSSGVRHRLQHALVVSQIALSIVLVGSAGLLLRSYGNLSRAELGFDPEHTIAFHVGAAWDENRVRVGQLQERLIAELSARPDVVAAGMTSFLPSSNATLRYQVTLEGRAVTDDNGKITIGQRTIGGGYLRAMGAALVAGSWCPDLHTDFTAPRHALVNRAFAQKNGADLVGRHIIFDQFSTNYEIVGIVGDIAEDAPGAPAMPYVYACDAAGSWPDPEYVVRTRGDERAVMAGVREIVHRLDPARAVFGVTAVRDVVAGALDRPRLNASMLSIFAAAAMALASLGLYSLLMLVVSERAREMGVRMALGASPSRVVALVFAGTGRLLGGGVLVGLALMVGVARLLRAALYGVEPLDAPTLGLTVLTLAAVTFLVSLAPARRAASADPIESMRAE